MSGERYSVLYVCAGDPIPDSDRARRRIGALFHETIFCGHIEQLAAYCAKGLGISLPNDGSYPSHWHRFIRECRVAEFLDVITMTYRYLFWHVSEGAADWWRTAATKIFADENLAYDIDNVGGVHPRIDREFQRNLASAVAGLEPDRHHGVRNELAGVEKNLSAVPPNYKQALRAIVSAVEGLFATMFPYAVLTGEEIERRLLPMVERCYDGDPAAQKAAQSLVIAFKAWCEASRLYRHQPGSVNSSSPPPDVAVFLISSGASLLRWLVGLDQAQAASDEPAAECPQPQLTASR